MNKLITITCAISFLIGGYFGFFFGRQSQDKTINRCFENTDQCISSLKLATDFIEVNNKKSESLYRYDYDREKHGWKK